MSAPNFGRININGNELPIFAFTSMDYEIMAKKEHVTFTDNDVDCWLDDIYNDSIGTIEEANQKLQYFTVITASGYYDGIQLAVKPTNLFYEKKTKAKDKEIERLPRILERIAKSYGMSRYDCIGIASNGEGFYNRKEIA